VQENTQPPPGPVAGVGGAVAETLCTGIPDFFKYLVLIASSAWKVSAPTIPVATAFAAEFELCGPETMNAVVIIIRFQSSIYKCIVAGHEHDTKEASQ
jgi:hypothetical protein